jgi:anti-sigma factor (TIGR02949 family)
MIVNDCRDRARMLGPYLDGELEAATLIEIDEHVGACETCREEAQLLCAIRGSLKRVVRGSAPSGLRERIGNAMTAERAREEAADRNAGGFGAVLPLAMPSSWRTVVPLATAAALALLWGAATRNMQAPAREARVAGIADDLLAELVAEHSQPLPPEATDAKAVRGLERYVGVPVRPANFESAGGHFIGGRVVPFHSQRAAMLQYEIGTGENMRRVSVLVYDAQKIQIGTRLAPREVGTAEVRVGREKGYSVAATERGGVGYLVASDLDTDKSAQLAAIVYNDQR